MSSNKRQRNSSTNSELGASSSSGVAEPITDPLVRRSSRIQGRKVTHQTGASNAENMAIVAPPAGPPVEPVGALPVAPPVVLPAAPPVAPQVELVGALPVAPPAGPPMEPVGALPAAPPAGPPVVPPAAPPVAPPAGPPVVPPVVPPAVPPVAPQVELVGALPVAPPVELVGALPVAPPVEPVAGPPAGPPAGPSARPLVESVMNEVLSEIFNPDVEGPVPSVVSGQCLPEEELAVFISNLQGESVREKTQALFRLRREIMDRGQIAQMQIFQCRTLFELIVQFIETSPSHAIKQAACRAICAIFAKNKIIVDSILETIPTIPAKLFEYIVESTVHLTSNCTGACTSDEDKEAIGENSCGILKTACIAMWVLCTYCMNNKEFQAQFVHTQPICRAVIAHLATNSEEAMSSSSWLLFNAVFNSPSRVPELIAHGVMQPLLDMLARGMEYIDSKTLGCLAIRALVLDDNQAKNQCAEMNGVMVLGNVIRQSKEYPSTQASAVWALGTLAIASKAIQDQVRETGFLKVVIDLLASPSAQVQNQAAGTVYNVCARNPENQTYVAACGGIEKLVSMLPKVNGSVKIVEKVVAALLCLALKNPDNQFRISIGSGCENLLIRLIGCSSSRIQGLTAGLIRTLSAEQPFIQKRFASHGAFPYLAELTKSRDPFAQEQAIAAMYNLMSHSKINQQFFTNIGAEKNMFAILDDCTKPTKLAFMCAIMNLYIMCENAENEGEKENLKEMIRSNKPVMDALLRFCHPACNCPRLRGHANKLLLYIDPVLHANRVVKCCGAILGALPIVRPNSTRNGTLVIETMPHQYDSPSTVDISSSADASASSVASAIANNIGSESVVLPVVVLPAVVLPAVVLPAVVLPAVVLPAVVLPAVVPPTVLLHAWNVQYA